jgi:putative N6-adenine-specific DNA methylase
VIAATSTFGLESVVASELHALGYADAAIVNGRVAFEGGEKDIARCNLWLRAADRLLIRLADFPSPGLDAVYEGVKGIPWPDFLPRTPRIVVTARSSGRGREEAAPRAIPIPSLQSVGKKAIVDSLAAKRGGGRIEETGPLYSVEIAVSSGRASVCLDTSGEGLHKRGYRMEAGEAPLRENLAAGMVLLGKWDASRPFMDPLCGSGTIPIEAALIGQNIAPGTGRSFAAEQWPHIPSAVWRDARAEAADLARRGLRLRVEGSDKDGRVIEAAGRNAQRVGVQAAVSFHCAQLEEVRPEGEYGCIVTNPPYAERLGSPREVEAVYRALGKLRKDNPTWSVFALTAHPMFPRLFGGTPSRNRKLYNGNIRCYYYQYFGPLPRGRGERTGSPSVLDNPGR